MLGECVGFERYAHTSLRSLIVIVSVGRISLNVSFFGCISPLVIIGTGHNMLLARRVLVSNCVARPASRFRRLFVFFQFLVLPISSLKSISRFATSLPLPTLYLRRLLVF